MLNVITLEEAKRLLSDTFGSWKPEAEVVSLDCAAGRVLARPVEAKEFVPGFDRSTVDGYALRAADTFGCGESIPALLSLVGEVRMGETPDVTVQPGQCAYIPTGGCLPTGADAVVMLEYAEDYGDGTVGIQSPCAPGAHLIFRGDDTAPGKELLPAGKKLGAKEIGALAAAGVGSVSVLAPPRASVFSTGDELIPVEQAPAPGQVRDVNGPMLAAALEELGCRVCRRELLRDDPELLRRAISQACGDSDMVFLSGGSSVGVQDAAYRVLSELGTVLFHGLAVKPGKPTLLADVGGVPVFGLPGHPAAAWFLFRLLAVPWICGCTGRELPGRETAAALDASLPSNHGREEYVLVRLKDGRAIPLWNKSGLITSLSQADGYLRIPRDAEGISAGSRVTVTLI